MTTKPKTMELKLTRTIPATPAEVFSAWMDPKHPGNPWTDAKKLIFDARVDGLFYFATSKGESWPHYGRFLALEPGRRAQYGWMSPFTRGLESVVTVTFEKKGDGTLVTLTHANLPDDEYGRLHDDGWTDCLSVFVEQFQEAYAKSV
jgi:uncharacterized protein YndB with AHSA1/START domain